MGVVVTGEAKDEKELFAFEIKPFVTGGFMLSIRFNGDGRGGLTGAGVWPSIEKAKEVAQTTAARLLHGAAVTWMDRPA